MSRKIAIFDTTLRDGEQSPGASMNTEEKLIVARQLIRLGVDVIEVGRRRFIGEVDHMLQGEVPDREGLEFGVTRFDPAERIVVHLA